MNILVKQRILAITFLNYGFLFITMLELFENCYYSFYRKSLKDVNNIFTLQFVIDKNAFSNVSFLLKVWQLFFKQLTVDSLELFEYLIKKKDNK